MHLTRSQTHTVWDNALTPAARVGPGEELTLDLLDAGSGHFTAGAQVEQVATMDFDRVNPVTGPVHVEGAEPGDALSVTILDLDVGDFGWTANIPGFGLLRDELPDPHLWISRVAGGRVSLPIGVELPSVPMIGTLGVALPEPGRHSIVPPSRYGGNMDIRHLTAGATVHLPVGVPGALLSIGDTHAAMGDGEVCGTGIEIGATVRIRVDLVKGWSPAYPVLETVSMSGRQDGALAVTGVGPDLWQAARDATRGMLAELWRRTRLAEIDAYLLASVAADLKISEIVDLPNYVVTLQLGRQVLDALGTRAR